MTRSPLRFRPEALVFASATAIALLHALDDAFAGRQPGVGAGQHLIAALVAIAASLVAVWVFPSLRPGLRAALAAGFGVLATVNGMTHVLHLRMEGPSGSDLSGVLAALAGLVLVGLAASIPWRHRGAGAATRRGRWAVRAVAVPATVAGALFLLLPLGMAIVDTHKWREPVGEPPSAAYQDVTFRSSDNLKMAGWYRPSRNGAAVIVLHGGGSDRRGAKRHAQLLARHGYGVLLYDARGRGESEGQPNSWGWGWEKDAAGAIDFLERRPDVDPHRIGGLGLSSGADTLIDAAARHGGLSALVADGAVARARSDTHADPVSSVGIWAAFTSISVISGSAPPPPLEGLVARIKAPTLLISGGTSIERDANVRFDRAARGPVEHWNLPDVTHTAALRSRPEAYERRVVPFLDRALLQR